jgi:Zn finger protein HypA/HybF involved in hydrogenase expression
LKKVREWLPANCSSERVVVRLRVSELSGLTAPALQAAFDHAHACHAGPQVEVDLRCEGLLGHCARCGRVVEVTPDLACAECGDTGVTLAAGETLLIEEISVVPAEPHPLPPLPPGEGVVRGAHPAAHEH